MTNFCTSQRLARLTRACSFRMSGLRLVLDGLAGKLHLFKLHIDARHIIYDRLMAVCTL